MHRPRNRYLKSIRLLSHPIVLGAIALLLVNDHLLRRVWPSWVTGKLGDVAWLLFAPLALAALLVWLLPIRGSRREPIAAGLAFGLIAAVFVGANTSSLFHDWLVRALQSLTGVSLTITRDPSDLAALPSLAAGCWLWRRTPAQVPFTSRRGWVALSLAALLTLANSAAPNYGVHCLAADSGRLIAASAYETYESDDGGLSWQPFAGDRFALHDRCPDEPNTRLDSGAAPSGEAFTSPGDPDVRYRLTPQGRMERSTDDGATWQVEFQFAPTGEAGRIYFEKTTSGAGAFLAGPLDVLTDPASGNLILAMGYEGALVRQSTGAWGWVPVGPYHRVELDPSTAAWKLLDGETALALIFGALCMATWSLHMTRRRLHAILVALAWLAWLFCVIVLRPVFVSGYGFVILVPVLIATGLLALALSFYAAFLNTRLRIRMLLQSVLAALIGALLFFLPYELWGLGSLPSYTMAMLFGLILGGVTLYAGDFWFRRSVRLAGGVALVAAAE
jgi:hypothetical protein